MKEYLTITGTEGGIVITVDRSLITAAIKDGNGMHAFNSVNAAMKFIRAELKKRMTQP